MNRIYPRGLAVLLSLGTVVRAQSVIGTWQGTLPTIVNPRTVLKISETPDHHLRGLYDLIDRDAAGIPLSAIAFHSPDLSLALDYLGITYQGMLSPDGRSIMGTWTQNDKSYPLMLTLATPETLWSAPAATILPFMPASADPTFDVATIKPSPPEAKGLRYALKTRRFEAHNASVLDLIHLAYDVRARQVEGAPAWISEDRFDISAQPDIEGQPSIDQQLLMLRKLLAERFGLRFHKVQKVFPVYLMTVAHSSPNLSPSIPDARSSDSIVPRHMPNGQWLVRFSYESIAKFAGVLMNFMPDRQFVDQTGLSGPYDFILMLPPGTLDEGTGSRDTTLDPGPAFFHAAETQLGLKLEPTKAPIDVLVIDRVEKPSAN